MAELFTHSDSIIFPNGVALSTAECATVFPAADTTLSDRLQALDRTAPMLPMQPGLPERRTYDYRRHGTTTLFAALEIATGAVTAACKPRHRHQEFLAFLKQVARAYPDQELHLVMDNYAAHKRIEIRTWLERLLEQSDETVPLVVRANATIFASQTAAALSDSAGATAYGRAAVEFCEAMGGIMSPRLEAES